MKKYRDIKKGCKDKMFIDGNHECGIQRKVISGLQGCLCRKENCPKFQTEARKCKHKNTILCKAVIDELFPDDEPRESGSYEEIDPIEYNKQVLIYYCEDCKKIVDVWDE